MPEKPLKEAHHVMIQNLIDLYKIQKDQLGKDQHNISLQREYRKTARAIVKSIRDFVSCY